LVVAITTIQAAGTASREHAAAIEAVSQQEQAGMAAAAATTSGAATTLTNLVVALTALQPCVPTAEDEAQ
jgi:hypothetical protein